MAGLMQFDDLLALVPGLKRRRSLNAELLRDLLDRNKGECTWCGKTVERPRRTWCSDECANAFLLRCSPNHIVAHVAKRDMGRCQLCDRDIEASRKEYAKNKPTCIGFLDTKGMTPAEQMAARKENRKAIEAAKAEYGYGRGRWQEVDHIVPVSQYGGLCEPSNLRLLCGQCHLGVTNELAKQRKG